MKDEEKQEIEITPEMIQAVIDVINSGDAYIHFDEVYGHDCSEDAAEKIILASLYPLKHNVQIR